jgi:hypothetical protein
MTYAAYIISPPSQTGDLPLVFHSTLLAVHDAAYQLGRLMGALIMLCFLVGILIKLVGILIKYRVARIVALILVVLWAGSIATIFVLGPHHRSAPLPASAPGPRLSH